ncbi:hypothetical protein BX616_007795, partial [Lobosporangium transversale]
MSILPQNRQSPHPPPTTQTYCLPRQETLGSAPLILMRPPTRIEDLKAKPGVVVCQHCRHLVITETSPEN